MFSKDEFERRGRRILAAAGIALAAGCGGQYDAAVTGMVKLDGKEITRGMVQFIPTAAGPTGYGQIDSSGGYSIATGREEGLPSGDYTVTVVVNELSIPNKNPSLPPTPGKAITPAWYREKAASPLKKTVERGDNEIDLELSSTPPPEWKPPKGQR